MKGKSFCGRRLRRKGYLRIRMKRKINEKRKINKKRKNKGKRNRAQMKRVERTKWGKEMKKKKKQDE